MMKLLSKQGAQNQFCRRRFYFRGLSIPFLPGPPLHWGIFLGNSTHPNTTHPPTAAPKRSPQGEASPHPAMAADPDRVPFQ